MKRLITVLEARRHLGKDADALSDEQVEVIIEHLDFIARLAIDQYLKDKQK